LRNGQVGVLVGIVGARHFLLILVVIFFFLLRALLHLLLHFLLTRLLLLLLRLRLHVDVHVDLIFFLIRVDLFGVIDIDSEVEGLVLHFVSLHVRGLLDRFGARRLR
jgi:hypothetical protein